MPTPAHPISPDTPDRLLTLALPHGLQDELIGLLHALPDPLPGFSLVQGHGLGADASLASPMEQVLGRARRVFVQIALPQSRVPELLAQLHQALPSPEIAYWVQPLLAFGRLA